MRTEAIDREFFRGVSGLAPATAFQTARSRR
jgi:hypothetical protein